MQKIVIKNFGPIRDAEIEIRPITVLLGEQATGKSTVAQLVHFFNSLRSDWLGYLLNKNRSKEQLEEGFLDIIDEKFSDYYGTNTGVEKHLIRFYFDVDKDKYVQIEGDKWSKPYFSESCKDDFELIWPEIATFQKFDLEHRYEAIKRLLSSFLINPNEKPFDDSVFFIAGRNITVAFSETFRTFFIENYQKTKSGPFGLGIHSGQSYIELTQNFIEYSAALKDVLAQYDGGRFDTLFNVEGTPHRFREDFNMRSSFILKGEYSFSGGLEQIKIESDENNSISLNKASSGQQECIRILQDLLVISAFEQNSFRTIEEPESHLFPSAQNALTELLVMTHNRTGSHFFLTTHSPYFLSSFNNLLYAAKAAGDNLPEDETPNPEHIKQVEELGYPKHLRLLAKNFAAYQLKDGTAISIYDPEKAITDIDGLDAVSFEIAAKFETLAEIVREVEYEEG